MQDDDIVIESESEDMGASEADLEAQESSAAGKVEKLKREIEALKKEKQEYLDGWQRAKADYVNALKRFEDEKAGAIALGMTATLKSFIPALDSLARARSAGSIPEGFEGIAKQFEDAARALGLEPFGAVGERFDPMQHEALGQDTTEDAAQDDTVTAVLEHGWKSKGLVIRPAKVRVAAYAPGT